MIKREKMPESHKLDPIKRSDIFEAAKEIYNMDKFPANHNWNEYYVIVSKWKYPFKYLTKIAYKKAVGEDIEFVSNESNRNKIKELGFDIFYQKGGVLYNDVNKKSKMARITWNDYSWSKPSGPEGKSSGDNYEGRNKFGHEEWLFDEETIIDGYKYGFLQPIHKFRQKYENKIFDISLYTYNNDTKKYYWVKTLKNVEVISIEESRNVLDEYKKRGWFNSMKEDLKEINVPGKIIYKWKQERAHLFNIKFDASQLGVIDLIEMDGEITIKRYQLIDANKKVLIKYAGKAEEGYSFENSGSTESSCKTSKSNRTYLPGAREIEMIHNKLQKQFHEFLQKRYGNKMVKRECTSYGRRIDLSLKNKQETVFYEIKTFSNPLSSIREAVGQLLEYCLYYGKQNANKITIVTHKKLDDTGILYFKDLQKIIHIPLHYICFDLKENKIIQQL